MVVVLFFVSLITSSPSSGRSSPLGGYEGWTAPIYGILPGLTIGLGGAAWYSRMLRSSMLDILGADYVKAARAKGLPERTVV